MGMNALTLSALIAFWRNYPDAEAALRAWHTHIRGHEYGSFAEVKADFPSADWVKGFIVFDIGGNKYRLIVRPNFDGKRFYIEHVLTHKGYDAWTREMRST
jgi:mRNA interferase HigB